MHEEAADALGVRCHYHLIEVAGADQAGLRALLDGVRSLGFAGVNVTFPYKEAVIPLLDELSPRAREVGAINTVVVRDGRLVGYNTDTTGFERAIADVVNSSRRGPVALVGAGGVGKAIAFALASLGVAELCIFDTDHAKAAQLANQLHGRLTVRLADRAEHTLQDAVGLINATPIGMSGRGMRAGGTVAWRALGCGRRLYAALDPAADCGEGKGRPHHERARPCRSSGRRCL